ncbi:MAG TPA: tryptophan synthase subunit alpha [Bryobacteraceae bacterium]|nr:tryptophan synthase subunit alpha [Bryobacteraceae bacterium]
MPQTRIQSVFNRLQRQRRAALIAYLTAGDPTPGNTPAWVAALERGGADLIELGVPFSDPIADGPVIQRAADRALQAGTTLAKVLAIGRTIRETSQIPLLLFTYLNPALQYGFETLARDAKDAGFDGCLLTDLSVEEAEQYVQVMRAAQLDTVFLAAPTSTESRLRRIAKYSSGFIYLVSRTGVTGERAALSDSIEPLVRKMRAITPAPLAVGFGVSTPQQAGAVAHMADGVVVGSAIVRMIENQAAEKDLEAFVRSLREGMALAAAL